MRQCLGQQGRLGEGVAQGGLEGNQLLLLLLLGRMRRCNLLLLGLLLGLQTEHLQWRLAGNGSSTCSRGNGSKRQQILESSSGTTVGVF